jgi:hypothetical protein
MENLSGIKWHAQELGGLLKETGNQHYNALIIDLETYIVMAQSFRQIEAVPPLGISKTIFLARLKHLKQKLYRRKSSKSQQSG